MLKEAYILLFWEFKKGGLLVCVNLKGGLLVCVNLKGGLYRMVLAVQVLLVHTSKCHRKVQIYNPLVLGLSCIMLYQIGLCWYWVIYHFILDKGAIWC